MNFQRNLITSIAVFIIVVVALSMAIMLFTKDPISTPTPVTVETVTPTPITIADAPVVFPTESYRGDVSVTYLYTDSAKFFNPAPITVETITFARRDDGAWQTKQLSLPTSDNVLFQYDIFESATTGCPINLYREHGTIEPLCSEIPQGTAVTYTVQIVNCESDIYGNLICTNDYDQGSINYYLSYDTNTFRFSYSGIYYFEYEEKVTNSLTALGFQNINYPADSDLAPGKVYTFTK